MIPRRRLKQDIIPKLIAASNGMKLSASQVGLPAKSHCIGSRGILAQLCQQTSDLVAMISTETALIPTRQMTDVPGKRVWGRRAQHAFA